MAEDKKPIEHKPTIAWVEALVRRKKEKGGTSAAELKRYRKALMEKHSIPEPRKQRKPRATTAPEPAAVPTEEALSNEEEAAEGAPAEEAA